jgi:ABC-type Na+ transport system ATPase subunit NatA
MKSLEKERFLIVFKKNTKLFSQFLARLKQQKQASCYSSYAVSEVAVCGLGIKLRSVTEVFTFCHQAQGSSSVQHIQQILVGDAPNLSLVCRAEVKNG